MAITKPIFQKNHSIDSGDCVKQATMGLLRRDIPTDGRTEYVVGRVERPKPGSRVFWVKKGLGLILYNSLSFNDRGAVGCF